MSSIECKWDWIKEDDFDGNKGVFLVGITDSELLWSLKNTILVVADSSKVGEEFGCKEGT